MSESDGGHEGKGHPHVQTRTAGVGAQTRVESDSGYSTDPEGDVVDELKGDEVLVQSDKLGAWNCRYMFASSKVNHYDA